LQHIFERIITFASVVPRDSKLLAAKMMCQRFFLLAALSAVSVFSADLDWWEGGNFYQIYPRSYMDSNGDGVGDLQGIKSKIAYVKDLGMTGVWLSPIMASPQADFGYDISDYRDIHWEYGTLNDFQELLDECKRHDLKLILDFVPNHTSDEHEWFRKSENRVPGYENYYVWRDGKIDPYTNLMVPPTNWLSFFRFGAWRWSNIRKQYYLHQFHYKQPDLNYRDPKLVQEMKDVLTYWLEKGVSGFRIDIIVCLFEALNSDGVTFPDEPVDNPNCDYDDFCYLNHIYTQDQNETFDMAYQWRELFDNFKKIHGGETKIIMTESWSDIDKQQRFYGDRKTRNGSYVPFNFEMIKTTDENSKAKDFKAAVDAWLKNMPKDVQANWVVSFPFEVI
jgi:alpha-glucosidase